MTLLVGTSGWQYRDWRGAFYPHELRQADWLRHYATRFATVEVNASFYRLPDRSRFAAWRAGTPDDFVLCPKVSRYLSHMKRLKDPDEPVGRFVAAVAGLEDKLGPALLQLPPTLRADVDRLDAALARFPPSMRVAVELRHETWFSDEVRAVLAARGAALCLADRAASWVSPTWRTAEWGYVRFHEGTAEWPCYTRDVLRARAGQVAALYGADADVYVFFNNDPRGCAVRDASWFAEEARAAGLRPTRVPPADEIMLVPPAGQPSAE